MKDINNKIGKLSSFCIIFGLIAVISMLLAVIFNSDILVWIALISLAICIISYGVLGLVMLWNMLE